MLSEYNSQKDHTLGKSSNKELDLRGYTCVRYDPPKKHRKEQPKFYFKLQHFLPTSPIQFCTPNHQTGELWISKISQAVSFEPQNKNEEPINHKNPQPKKNESFFLSPGELFPKRDNFKLIYLSDLFYKNSTNFVSDRYVCVLSLKEIIFIPTQESVGTKMSIILESIENIKIFSDENEGFQILIQQINQETCFLISHEMEKILILYTLINLLITNELPTLVSTGPIRTIEQINVILLSIFNKIFDLVIKSKDSKESFRFQTFRKSQENSNSSNLTNFLSQQNPFALFDSLQTNSQSLHLLIQNLLLICWRLPRPIFGHTFKNFYTLYDTDFVFEKEIEIPEEYKSYCSINKTENEHGNLTVTIQKFESNESMNSIIMKNEKHQNSISKDNLSVSSERASVDSFDLSNNGSFSRMTYSGSQELFFDNDSSTSELSRAREDFFDDDKFKKRKAKIIEEPASDVEDTCKEDKIIKMKPLFYYSPHPLIKYKNTLLEKMYQNQNQLENHQKMITSMMENELMPLEEVKEQISLLSQKSSKREAPKILENIIETICCEMSWLSLDFSYDYTNSLQFYEVITEEFEETNHTKSPLLDYYKKMSRNNRSQSQTQLQTQTQSQTQSQSQTQIKSQTQTQTQTQIQSKTQAQTQTQTQTQKQTQTPISPKNSEKNQNTEIIKEKKQKNSSKRSKFSKFGSKFKSKKKDKN
ncbi:synovial sarcoma associated ss18 protein [Anaeramoeba flamelloides]|uniref:Synovial sarcoma associated ss18 protein n=1 Tax=Anaeramoeba flamelloides TaxID=1746091 RepID=A0ABQ8ZEV9_9EUKA|nr:synovial sarcoma associated ss18 protein [Anaeramoeba flamelloides]